MISDIYDFLPMYSQVESDDFYNSIFSKQEFYNERINAVSDNYEIPSDEYEIEEKCMLLKQQKFIARFLSIYTPYNSLILKHQTGTGKTLSAISAIEQIRAAQLPDFKAYDGALFLARGNTLLDNIRGEILKYYKLCDNTNTDDIQSRKDILKFYMFGTFQSFVINEISKYDDDYIISKYSNKIIVIDEVHNIRLIKSADNQKNISVYASIHRLLHTVKNCKIILLSATLMKDSVKEIATILNLILPMSEQLPTGNVFLKEYFNSVDGFYRMKEQKVPTMRAVIKGRISYLDSEQSEVKLEYKGKKIKNLKYFNVIPNYMTDEQNAGYENAYSIDNKILDIDVLLNSELEDDDSIEYNSPDEEETNRGGQFSINSRQSSLFVFPDGSYGRVGFKKYILSPRIYQYKLSDELKKALYAPTKEGIINKIRKCSSKYADCFTTILKSQANNQSSFVYSELVEGSGAILFSLLLGLLGFEKYIPSPDNINTEKKRYAIITNNTTTIAGIKNTIKQFNTPLNKFGKIINVIIGSAVVSEGITFKNVQNCHILSPHWNYSDIEQAIGRGYRYGSHYDLIQAGVSPEYNVYQYVSIPKKIQSIDLTLYKLSEIKDVSIKGIDQLLKTSAVDCALFYGRNHTSGYDYERRCNYTNCDYKCEGINTNNSVILDKSTYQVYYSRASINRIQAIFQSIFRKQSFIYISNLNLQYKDNFTPFEIYKTVDICIAETKLFTDKYGLNKFLCVDYMFDMIFLNSDINSYNKLDAKYTEQPILTMSAKLEDVIGEFTLLQLPDFIQSIFSLTDTKQILEQIELIQPYIRELVFEACFISIITNSTVNTYVRDIIFDKYRYAIQEISKGLYISSLIYRAEGILRCLEITHGSKMIWKDCSDDMIAQYQASIQKITSTLKQQDYFGTYNADKFCIVMTNQDTKGNKINSGKVCSSWKTPILNHLIINVFNIQPTEQLAPLEYSQTIKELNKPENKKFYIEDIINNIYSNIAKCSYDPIKRDWTIIKYTLEEIQELSDDTYFKILFYSKIKKPKLCQIIRKYFQDNNQLIFDENCGSSKKKKI